MGAINEFSKRKTATLRSLTIFPGPKNNDEDTG